MSDLTPGGYHHFVCVETGSVVSPIELAAGQEWKGSQGMSIVLKPQQQTQNKL